MESRRSVAATVAWMLTALAALIAETIAIVFEAVLASTDGSDALNSDGLLLPNLMWFIAAASGLVCLGLTLLVYRYRPLPPPVTITVAAVLISVAPMLRGLLWLAAPGA